MEFKHTQHSVNPIRAKAQHLVRFYCCVVLLAVCLQASAKGFYNNHRDDKMSWGGVTSVSNAATDSAGITNAATLFPISEVHGFVTDSTGKGIEYVAVKVKGAARGTLTGRNGEYTLKNVPDDAVLEFSFMGMKTEEAPVNGRSTVSVTLYAQTSDLSDIVVVGYGTQKVGNVTGAMTVVGAPQIQDKPFTSVDKTLQGNVAGLQSSSTSGAPGSTTDIRIRGIGSINASSQPLWVIDGAIATTGDLTSATTTANALSGLNPDDIESITVLKDASATAIYGSKGANGVIVVTTKKGRAGKTRLNFSTEDGAESNAFYNKKVSAINTTQYINLLKGALINAGYMDATDPFDPYWSFNLGIDPNVNTDWYNVVSRTGNQNQLNLSLSGGTEKTQFYASGGYYNQDGTTIATNFRRYNGALSVTHKPIDRITFSAGINGSYAIQHTPTDGGAFANPVLSSMFTPPWYAPYNADGSIRYGDNDTTNTALYGPGNGQFANFSGMFNPVAIANMEYTNTRMTSLRGYVSGEFYILKNLKFTSRYSAEYLITQEDQYWSPFYGDGYSNDPSVSGYAFASNRQTFDWTWSNLLDYKANLNASKDFYVDVMAGEESYKYNNYQVVAQGNGMPPVGLYYAADATTYGKPSSLPDYNATNSYLGNVVFNYKNKYVLTGSFRRDGSSVFSAEHKWGNFYSVGGTWNINEENFMKSVSWIDLLKLRASYGENGNCQLNPPLFTEYQSLAYYTYGWNYNGQMGQAPYNVGNPDLTWEKNKEFNVGVDWGFFKDRFTGTIEYYNRVTSDLLINVPLSGTSGFLSQDLGTVTQLINAGSMRNQGVELTLGGVPVRTKDFAWNMAFNITHNQNRVLDLYGNQPIPYQTRFEITEGHDMMEYYLRSWAGVDPATGDPLWYTDGTKTATTNNVNNAKLDYTGKSASPKLYGSFTNTFTYKGFSLSFMLYYNFGNYLYDSWGSFYNSDGAYLGYYGQSKNMLRAWQKPGDITDVPRQIVGGNDNSNASGTRWLYSDNYIRLRDVELAYMFTQKWVKSLRISTLQLYVHGTNLFTFATAKYLPFDPEQGVDMLTNFEVYVPKTMTVGLKIGL